MKRLLAVLLALTMTLTCAPLSALAASDDTLAKSITVEQTTQPDAELVQAIAADPFMQPTQASAPQQEQSASVDTSDISMTATNSFGKLLLDGMNGNEEENGTEFSDDNRVIGIKMNGGTATVEYVAAEAADLVVAVYTDSAAEEMVASGTVSAPATVDNTGNSTVQVPVEGSIPEYYTVKAYLLDKAEHAPLSKVFTDTSKTEAIVDIKNAQVGDFDPDRVINLDDDNTTNFAVVKKNVTLITPDDNPMGRSNVRKNNIIGQDDEGLNYTIADADEEVKNLKPGDILALYDSNENFLVVRVSDITVSGNTVTIHGDDTLEVTDVFDVVKVEDSGNTEQLDVVEGSVGDGVTYLGDASENSMLDETNSPFEKEWEFGIGKSFELFKKEDSREDFWVEPGTPGNPSNKDDSTTSTVTLTGTVDWGVKFKAKIYLNGKDKNITFSSTSTVSGEVELSGKMEEHFKLCELSKMIAIGVYLKIEPAFVVRVEGKANAQFSAEATSGIMFDGSIHNTSTEPTAKLELAAEVSVFVGIDLTPKLEAIGKLVSVSITAEVGVTADAKRKENLSTIIGETKHQCKVCYTAAITGDVTVSASVSVEEDDPDQNKVTIYKSTWTIGDAYYAPEFNDVGIGDCPHTLYRVRASIDGVKIEGVEIYEKNSDDTQTTLGSADENGVVTAYLAPGTHLLTVVIEGKRYNAEFEIKDKAVDVVLKVSEESSGTCGDNLTWTFSEDGTLTISGNGPMPDYADETHGTRYDRPWEELCDKIKTVILKRGVTNTGESAFADCVNLVKVSMTDTITSIGFASFHGCSSLEEITIPENVTTIGYAAFEGCMNLKKVTIPKTVKAIYTGAFNSRNLKDVYYGGTIAEWKNIEIDESYYNLDNATIHCTDGDIIGKANLAASGNCGENITWMLDVDGTLVISGIGDMVLGNYPEWHDYAENVKAVQIDPQITSIGNFAFMDCTNLSYITIPDGITRIGENAFANCIELQNIVIPETVTDIGSQAFIDCKSLTDVVIPYGVTEINHGTFAECTKLRSVELPVGVTRIGDEAFISCTALQNVEIQEGLISIESQAFTASTLEKIELPDTIEEIDVGAFRDCKRLKTVTIGANLTSIGGVAFDECDSLESITMPSTVAIIGERAFNNCQKLKSVTFVDSTGEKRNEGIIKEKAFYGCKNLEEIAIPDGITKIESWVFGSCEKLQNVIIPDSVTSIEKSTFHWCDNLKKVVLPAGITEIPEAMFCFDYKLTDVVIPETVTSIGSFAFADCQSLTNINIPNGVASIGEQTFRNCESLTDVYYDGTKEQWQAISIDSTENDALLNATIHCTDGDITPETDSTNAISFGTTTQSSETYHALFSGLTAGEDYAVIVSRSAEQPLKAGNLAYIIQLPAGADGTLDVKFKAQNAEDLSYVVACRRGEDRHRIEVTHGRSSDAEAVSDKQVTITAEDRSKEGYKFSKWAVLSGDVTLANAEQAETTFVMGCQDVKLEAIYVREGHSIRVIDGTADKNTAYKDEKVTITAKDRSSEGKTFVKWNVLAGGVTLADASSPSTTFGMGTQEVTVQAVYQAANTNPGTSGGSGGGGGGGGAIALIGGAAVVAGVVAMLPAKVSGVVLSADAVLPNAAVQLVQKGAVVAQTVTDANGSFTLKAKRGAYQLNITYQDTAGQPVTQSVAVTAPAENLTLRF